MFAHSRAGWCIPCTLSASGDVSQSAREKESPPHALVEVRFLRAVLGHWQGNRAAAAEKLGIHRTRLRERLRKYGID